MKANVITGHGQAREVFRIMEVPDPKPLPDDLIVKVLATSVNPLDLRIRSRASVQRQFPLILGFDVCGIVVDMGANVKGFSLGDRVMGAPSPFRSGANAEFVAIDYRSCAQAGALDDAFAAAIPLVGITAYEALFDRLRVRAGDLVVIHAGAGGVGHLAIQMARQAGCKVITTASRPESIRYCAEVLQAEHVLNYRQTDVGAAIMELTGSRGASLILDTVGGDTFRLCLDYVGANGHICTILPGAVSEPDGYRLLLKNVTLSYQFMGGPLQRPEGNRQGQVLAKLANLISEGSLQPVVSEMYDWHHLPAAHQALETGHTTGKIVIRVSS